MVNNKKQNKLESKEGCIQHIVLSSANILTGQWDSGH